MRPRLGRAVRFLIASIVLCLPTGYAQEATEGKPATSGEAKPSAKKPSKAKKKSGPRSRALPHWYFTLGVRGGAASETDVTAPEGHTPHDGELVGLDLTVSRVIGKLMYDMGFGWSTTKLRGKEPFPGDGRVVRTVVTTNAVLFKGGVRYRLAPFFGLGANLSQWYSPDLSFSSYETSPKTGTFFGVSMDFWFTRNHKSFGLGLGYESDLTIPKRRVSFTTLALTFGLPVTPPERRVRVKRERPAPTGEAVGFVIVRSIFDQRIFQYEAAGVRPSEETEAFIKEFATATLAVRTDFRGLVVRVALPDKGESDNPAQIDLAKQRSDLLKQMFIAAGYPPEGLKASGIVSKKVKADGDVQVEFNFINVKDGVRLNNVIEGVRAKYGITDD